MNEGQRSGARQRKNAERTAVTRDELRGLIVHAGQVETPGTGDSVPDPHSDIVSSGVRRDVSRTFKNRADAEPVSLTRHSDSILNGWQPHAPQASTGEEGAEHLAVMMNNVRLFALTAAISTFERAAAPLPN